MNELFINALKDIVGSEKILLNEPMSRHTTFKIGGMADYFIKPSEHDEIKGIINLCKEYDIPYYVIGNGSNLLVGDKGYRGAIIQIFSNMNKLSIDGNVIYADAGCSLAYIAQKALESELTGFEFAAGIPGSLGGAVVMNAGAYGGEMKDVIQYVYLLNSCGEIEKVSCADMQFGYRKSIVKDCNLTVLGAAIKLESGIRNEISDKMKELAYARRSKQPLEYPSAGSTFKRPEGHFAGKLIMDAGLRGFSVNDAQVSEKHCGFVINKGNATASDIIKLTDEVANKVKEKFGVTLELEIKQIGDF